MQKFLSRLAIATFFFTPTHQSHAADAIADPFSQLFLTDPTQQSNPSLNGNDFGLPSGTFSLFPTATTLNTTGTTPTLLGNGTGTTITDKLIINGQPVYSPPITQGPLLSVDGSLLQQGPVATITGNSTSGPALVVQGGLQTDQLQAQEIKVTGSLEAQSLSDGTAVLSNGHLSNVSRIDVQDLNVNGTFNLANQNAIVSTTSDKLVTGVKDVRNNINGMTVMNAGQDGFGVNQNGKIVQETVDQTTASMTVTNAQGNTHGFLVNENAAVMSGGTQSTSLTLDNNGARFSNTANGGPVQLHGVQAGSAPTDAVNVQQLGQVSIRAYSGIAQVAAMSAIPTPIAGKNYSLGMGGGFYAGQQAVAFGGKANVGQSLTLGASVSTGFANTGDMAASVGAGWSW